MKATKHSNTALVIAKSAVLVGNDPVLQQLQGLGAAEISEWFTRDYARDHRWLKMRWYRALLARLESWILPGIQLHYVARKRLIEQQVVQAIRDGVEQVIIIAGGFDTLCYRMHTQFREVRFVELDHPATRASKRKSLQTHGLVLPNLTLHPVDLASTSLTEALNAAGIDAKRPTLVVAEGVLMYIERDRVAALIAAVDAFFESELRLAITFMAPDHAGRRRFHNGSLLLDAWLWLVGEPFLSAFSHTELSQVLAQCQLAHHEFWDEERLKREVLPPSLSGVPIAVGEHICVGRRTK
jgi:methyltransferase (TIGR00027 family)